MIRLVGIDCATQDAKVGIAFGEFGNKRLKVIEAFTCTQERRAAKAIAKWIRSADTPALLAIDAPLGWPQPLSQALGKHRAGDELIVPAHSMFRRKTDVFIKQKAGQMPLDVGADRIARTAYAALRLLGDISRDLRIERIPLAWQYPSSGVAVIEVYPAATLKVQGFRSKGYKKSGQTEERTEIVKDISSGMSIPADVTEVMKKSADALDAVVCLLAARDFLVGDAMAPDNSALAEIEGWIWCRKPKRSPPP